jgi:hypothetical protein
VTPTIPGLRDHRFAWAAVVVPLGIAFAAGPLFSAASRLSGHPVHDGAVTVSSYAWFVVGAGPVITALLVVLVAVAHRLPLELGKYASLPLAAAGAAMSAGVVGGLTPQSVPTWATVAVLAAGGTGGVVVGRHTALKILDVGALPVSAAPAPEAATRFPLEPGGTAVWTGQVPPVRLRTWLIIVPRLALAVFVVRLRVVSPWLIVLLVVSGCAWVVVYRARRRYRITIGPTGVQLRTGLFKRLKGSIELGNIVAASTTRIDRLAIAGWRSTPRRLTIATRPGSALHISLTDQTDVVISLPDPAVPAAVINSLLDQRATARPGGHIGP